ncbi:MAG: HAMP domain-containing sensor histidine kinase [Nodosilinea sp.]
MASKNSPVLFQARPYEGAVRSSSHTEGRETWPIVHALAVTLNAPHPLPVLAEVLGTHLGAGACLLLCHYPNTNEVIYTGWHPDEAPTSQCLSTAKAGSLLDWQHRVALGLIQRTIESSNGGASLRWQTGVAALLGQEHDPAPWLRALATCTAIAVDGSGLQGAILLLGSGGFTVDQTVQANLGSLGAIAFHQHYLQGQAVRHAEQLRYLNYLKEDFLSTLNHELRTPLTSMMLAIRMLRRPDLTAERKAMYLDILEQQCSREINLVNDLLMLQTLDSKAAATNEQTADLGQLLSDLVEQSDGKFRQANLVLDLQLPSAPVVLATDLERLTRVLQELLDNACKYSAPATTVRLRLDDSPALNGPVTLRVTNLGMAIEADDLPHVFDKFRRGHSATRDGVAGTGTGLALVRGLVEQLGGTINVSSNAVGQSGQPQLWQTCFTLEFDRDDQGTPNV